MKPKLFYEGQEVISLHDGNTLERYDNKSPIPPLKKNDIYKIVAYSYKIFGWYVELNEFPGEWWGQNLFAPAGDISELKAILKEGESIKNTGTS